MQLVELDLPEPGERDVLIGISVCGVHHTGLDAIEGSKAPPPSLRVVPGHQVISSVTQLGKNASHFQLGDRVGVGWIFSSSGEADENISLEFRQPGVMLTVGTPNTVGEQQPSRSLAHRLFVCDRSYNR